MAMPAAKGLFHRAATSSGEAVTAISPERGTRCAEAVLTALELRFDQLERLQSMPMDKLIEASRASTEYGPVVDGRTLSRVPFSPDAPSISAHVPFMVGTNHDESRALIGENNQRLFTLRWDGLKQSLKPYAKRMGNLDQMIDLYRRMYPSYSPSDVFFAATTDSHDWRAAVLEIERRAALPIGAAPTYSYELRWGSPVDHGKYKACHGLDVPFIFDNVTLSHRMTGTGPEAYELAAQMSASYIAFARRGDPNTRRIPHWPPYDLARRATMAFDVVSTLVDDPRSEERRFFSQTPYVE
jgi:para-nitrobenzyl esterase